MNMIQPESLEKYFSLEELNRDLKTAVLNSKQPLESVDVFVAGGGDHKSPAGFSDYDPLHKPGS